MTLAAKNCCHSDTEDTGEDKHDCMDGSYVQNERGGSLLLIMSKTAGSSLWANLLHALNPLWSSQHN